MTYGRHTGFTIIEVMLFLAISGMLMAGILVGTGTALAQQRYKDAVSTLHSDIQQLFEDASVVQNTRDASSTECSGRIGMSDCVILGNLMVISGNTMTRYRVIGDEPTSTSSDALTSLRAHNPRTSSHDVRSSTLQWGTTVSAVSILVLRSPVSGSTYTFTKTGALSVDTANAVLDMIPASDSTNMGRRVICVDPNGWSVPEKLAVVIGANASSGSAIEIKTKESGCV